MRSRVVIALLCLGGCGDDSATPPTDAPTIDARRDGPSSDALVDAAPTPDGDGTIDSGVPYTAPCGEFSGIARVGTWRTLSTSGGPSSAGDTDVVVASAAEIFVVRYRETERSIYSYDVVGDVWRTIPIDA